jgi:hypothetical protein
MGALIQGRSVGKGLAKPKRNEQPKRRPAYLAVPRFVRIAERQIDNAAEVKPLPTWISERTD